LLPGRERDYLPDRALPLAAKQQADCCRRRHAPEFALVIVATMQRFHANAKGGPGFGLRRVRGCRPWRLISADVNPAA